ncbi:hypothetical protein [Vibrio mediterranei]|jgi:hypothetical protein|uniref:hypothetical protein n=1 Tax=Vibrio mediterranei TaxID=689 RepID=UPI0001540E61|nr:hypothetical protein [Vibrio mediterranei]EDL54790.1 hypothetical protein VSAK1_18729 [Vibrio mediterranei AK1]
MCELDEGYDDLNFELNESEVEFLGWNDKEWLIELMVFLLILVGAVAIVTYRVCFDG